VEIKDSDHPITHGAEWAATGAVTLPIPPELAQ
jgi:hypothetical protein